MNCTKLLTNGSIRSMTNHQLLLAIALTHTDDRGLRAPSETD